MITTLAATDHEEVADLSETLVATDGRPALDELNIAAAGIELGRKGIGVDAWLQTNVPHVWAAGDCTGTFNFAYAAGEQGRLAALNVRLATTCCPGWVL